MTVAATPYKESYAGNGVTTVFSVPFYFLADTDLVVSDVNNTTGVITPLVLNVGYTVTGTGTPTGGAVTVTTATATGHTLTIERSLVEDQPTHFVDGDPLPASGLEQALDRIVMLYQQAKTALDRAAKFAVGSPSSSDLPEPQEGYVLGWVSGKIKNLSAATAQLAADLLSTAVGKGAALLSYLAPYTGAVGRTQQSKNSDWVSVKDFGAKGDGVTDDSSAIQNAINDLSAVGGGTIYFPAGVYFVGTTGIVVTHMAISLIGETGASVLKSSASIAVPILTYGVETFTPRPQNAVIRSIVIDGSNGLTPGVSPGIGNPNAHGIKLWASNVAITDCLIKNCGGWGVYGYQHWDTWINNNQVFGNALGGIYSGEEGNNVTIEENTINYNFGPGIQLVGGMLVNIRKNDVEYNQGYGFYLLGTSLSASRNCQYTGNYHENNAINALYRSEIYIDRSGNEISDCYVARNYISNNTTGSTPDVKILSVNSCTVESNTLVGVIFNPAYYGVISINQPIADSTLLNPLTYQPYIRYDSDGVHIGGRLAKLSLETQEGTTSNQATLWSVSGRVVNSPYPTENIGPITHTWGNGMPTTGSWTQGSIQWNVAPTNVAGVPIGWVRVTNGSGNVLNTDWRAFGVTV